jgi:hypothetical protein
MSESITENPFCCRKENQRHDVIIY